MPKRNNIWLLISLLAMTAFLTVIILSGNSTDTISIDKNLFKVEDQTKIDRVILKKSGEEIKLHFDGSKWMINDSFEADRQLIQVFFATLLQAEPRRPVAQRLRDSIHQQITKAGVLRRRECKNCTPMRSFCSRGYGAWLPAGTNQVFLKFSN